MSLSYLFWKRVFDIGTSLLLIILCMPLLLFFSLLSLITQGKPILFKQTRTGLNNKSFIIWKFRTMKECIKEKGEHIYDWGESVPDEFIFKTGSNSQVTKLGKIYRKYSIDELPQLFNVLIGDMSIVGPRPEIPAITKYYDVHQARRLNVKPGITGYAQINGRSEINHGKKIKLDLNYVENCSILLDIKILLNTVVLVLKGKGAY
ncbi:sugar transferase [Sporosarcina siberiensis]|uniref:Sugar transferase n=1 Tax=Sporosarcina siberiensis TaxID=1365606 RepID=A0ABW4SFB5_9BACL